MPSISLQAPAKLNLFLHVTGRLPNGYHTLQSVFVLIDLCDTIELNLINDGVIRRTGDVIGQPEKDLCVRAARLLQQKFSVPLGVEINVTKRIPAGAGMGGGSSDAASTLLGLNQLWGLKLSKERLMELGQNLGADVPFFLLGTNAWVEGIGEKLTAIDVPEMTFAVVWPGVSQSTPEIFSHPLLTRDSKSFKMSILDSVNSPSEWMKLGRNDLEPVAKLVNPTVAKLFELLPEFRLTGSGSAAFAQVSEEQAERIFKALPTDWRHFLVKSLKIHPASSAFIC
ncbi:MAG TPA: 4-(cytidine 5'-diphospho)-2-C-methyl-D-erythritol kinase [Candidatus Aphodousia faecipullorum]|nr:4-(cytidine 5'-diphospho)-2-C-methyl-D-erythritol kinase [Candidatus Aphodousia faecipullorum]